MKLRLNNLFYTTNRQGKIDRLLELGAVIVEDGKAEDKKEEDNIKKQKKIDENVNWEDYTIAQLKDILDNKEIAYNEKAKKSELIELLEG